jgi:hypothetical protein
MANYKLQIDDFDENDYGLIAIHTVLEDYRLAYYINKTLPVNLSKSKNEIAVNIKEGETHFTRFHFEDDQNNISWNLIQNKNEVILKKKGNNFDLFTDTIQEISKKVYLLPEFKKVNFFLKIENPNSRIDIEKATEILNSIERISTVYTVDFNKIKNKNNLIF